jgi:hypothetical protein
VGPRAGLDAVEKSKIKQCRESNPGRPARSYTAWAIQPSPWTATLTWWEDLCLFDLKKADQRQSEIKQLAKASSKITELKQFR